MKGKKTAAVVYNFFITLLEGVEGCIDKVVFEQGPKENKLCKYLEKGTANVKNMRQ